MFGMPPQVPSSCRTCKKATVNPSGHNEIPDFFMCGHSWSVGPDGNSAFINLDDPPDDWCPIRIQKKMGFWGFLWHRIKVFFGQEGAIRSLASREDVAKQANENSKKLLAEESQPKK